MDTETDGITDVEETGAREVVETTNVRPYAFVLSSRPNIAKRKGASRVVTAKSIEDGDDPDFDNVLKDVLVNGKVSEHEELKPEENSEDDHETRAELYKMLKDFFVHAITIIIRRRELCPRGAFKDINTFGITVPVFLHPASLEYTEEVANKLISLMHRNCCEGCALHIMIEKSKALHVVQRFVFRTNGSIEVLTRADAYEESDDQTFKLEEVRAHCRQALLRLLSAESIKPMSVPDYSRWSVSIGLKKAFAVEEDIDELWKSDPTGHYFPWKKRLRSLANIIKDENSTKSNIMEVAVNETNTSCDNSSIDHSKEPSEQILEADIDVDVIKSEQIELTPADEQPKDLEPELNKDTTVDVEIVDVSSQNESHELLKSKFTDDEVSRTICVPLSSFPITSNSMVSIYSLEYAAPVTAINNDPGFPPKSLNRSPFIGLQRIAQMRRLLRHSSNNK